MPRATGQVHHCPDCFKTFSRSEFVLRHQRIKHLNQRPYQCACGISYARSDLLFRHRKKCEKGSESPLSVLNGSDEALVDEIDDDDQAGPPESLAKKRRMTNDSGGSGSSGGSKGKVQRKNARGSTSSPSSSSTSASSTEGDGQHRHGTDCATLEEQQVIRERDAHLLVLGDANDMYASVNNGAQDTRRYARRFNTSWDPPAGRDNGWEDAAQEDYKSVDPEKSMWLETVDADFLRTDEPIDSPYYLSPSAYALAFICQKAAGNVLPSVGALSKFVKTAANTFLPFMPIFHIPTLNASQAPIHFSYALAVAGAACEDDARAKEFADKSLIPKRDSVQRTFNEVPAHGELEVRFRLLQTIILYQMLAFYNRDKSRRDSAQTFVNQLVSDFKAVPVQECVLGAPDYVEEAMNGSMSLDAAWHKWIGMESAKRTVFLVLIASQQSPEPPQLKLSEIDLPLPCHEDAWNASSAVEWFSKMTARGSQPPRLSEALFGVGPDGKPIPSWLLGNFATTVMTAALSAAMKAGWTMNPPAAVL